MYGTGNQFYGPQPTRAQRETEYAAEAGRQAQQFAANMRQQSQSTREVFKAQAIGAVIGYQIGQAAERSVPRQMSEEQTSWEVDQACRRAAARQAQREQRPSQASQPSTFRADLDFGLVVVGWFIATLVTYFAVYMFGNPVSGPELVVMAIIHALAAWWLPRVYVIVAYVFGGIAAAVALSSLLGGSND